MKTRKKAEKVIDVLFEEIKSALPYELPVLTGAIVDLHKLIANPLRIFLYGFGSCLSIVIAYLAIRIIV